MKRQINPKIKAHLLRGGLYLLLLLAVGVIPFALAQRATSKQSAGAAPRLLGSTPVTTLLKSDNPADGLGLTRAISTPDAIFTPRPCCPMARSLLQGELIAVALPRARKCMTQRAGFGLQLAASTPHATITRRACCPTAWSWLQADTIAMAAFPRARNST